MLRGRRDMGYSRVKWTIRHTLGVGFLVALGLMLALQSEGRGTDTQYFRCNDTDAYIKERLQYRRRRIREACAMYGYESYQYRWNADFRVENILWRKIPKVASTYLATLLLRRLMKNDTFDCAVNECHVLLDQATESVRRMPSGWPDDRPAGDGGSLLVFRRPYSRLVSAYLDKIAGNTWLWEDIKRVSRQPNSTGAPTFAAFVDYLIWLEETGQPMDGHWDTQERMSRVCEDDFQYMVQLESLDEEAPYVIRMLGLEREARRPVTHRNSRRQPYSTSDFMEQLDETQMAKLDDIYRMDIILFNG